MHATFYVVRRIPHLFFSHSPPSARFLDARWLLPSSLLSRIARAHLPMIQQNGLTYQAQQTMAVQRK